MSLSLGDDTESAAFCNFCYLMAVNRITARIENAADVIRVGGIVAYPTETVYGIGALALEESPVRKVIALKQMALKPISLAVSNFEMLRAVAHAQHIDLLHQLLPGPVTVLLQKKNVVPDLLTAGSSLVGIRLPLHPVAKKLIDFVGSPITSTSANLTGAKPAVRPEHVDIDVDCILDGGEATLGPSTVVDLVNCKVVRRGAEYESVLDKVERFFSERPATERAVG
jgi:L-threonylcarbamoyladenylate synthase